MKLVGRYSLTLLSVLTTVILAMLAIQLWQLDRSIQAMKAVAESSLQIQLDEQLKTRGASMAEVLAGNIVSPLLVIDMTAIYELLLPIRSSEAVRAVYFFDPDGRIYHDGSKDIALYGEPIVHRAPDVRPGSHVAQLLTRPDSFAAVAPVVAGTDLLGSVYVELSRDGVTQPVALMKRRYDEIAVSQRRDNLIATGLTALVLTAMGLLLSIVAARRMARPILGLVSHTKRVAQGDYDVEVETKRRDELGELASAFAEMSAQIDAKTERIHYLAFHDRLTGLPNRAAFADALQAHFDVAGLSEPSGKGAVLFLDLDDFKRVNDTLSHEAGDQLLCKLGQRLKDILLDLGFHELSFGRRQIAPVARWGGDEFSLYLDGIETETDALQYAKKIIAGVARPFMIAGLEVIVRASVGVAFFPHDSDRVETLLGYADVAMYHAKEGGRSGALPYSASMSEASSGRLALESDLRDAIDNCELRVLYQPIFDPISESVHGIEAHLLWQHRERGLLDADAFMPIAESTGYAGTMGAWLISKALQDFGSWPLVRDKDLELTINMSSGQLGAQNLVESLAIGIERAGIDSGRVIMEITETRMFHNVLHAAQLLNTIRALGVQTWIDAFGSGYSSINRLRRLPLDGLKIDAGLIASLEDSADDRSWVAAVIALAHSLGLRVGAEGVSQPGQLDFLRRNGCDTVQGKYFGEAIASAETGEYLENLNGSPASPTATG